MCGPVGKVPWEKCYGNQLLSRVCFTSHFEHACRHIIMQLIPVNPVFLYQLASRVWVLCVDTILLNKCCRVEFILLTVLSAVWQHVAHCVPPSPYSQTSPNTCMALKEQFDLSPCVVIGGPGLVIHGPFDCWHVKCSVPIPKAESWFARSFRFQLFDLRPGSYYWLLMYLQAAKRLPLAHLAAAC